MPEPPDWQALRLCDALVERSLADGAYPEALDQLVRGYQRVIVSFCRAQLGQAGEGGRAEELAQDVFLAAYQRLPQWQRQAPLHAWLFGIARKRCLQERRNYWRRTQRFVAHRARVAGAVHRGQGIPLEARALSEDELERLRASLVKLRKWERELLTKYFLEGYTFAMLAQESAFWSESTLRTRVTQALARLRTLYLRTESPKG